MAGNPLTMTGNTAAGNAANAQALVAADAAQRADPNARYFESMDPSAPQVSGAQLTKDTITDPNANAARIQQAFKSGGSEAVQQLMKQAGFQGNGPSMVPNPNPLSASDHFQNLGHSLAGLASSFGLGSGGKGSTGG